MIGRGALNARGHGAPAAHGAQQLVVGQRVRLLESHPHNLKVVGSNPTPATKLKAR